MQKSLDGLRDAPAIWAAHLRATLVNAGFLHSPTVPGIFVHPQRRLQVAAHVDDVLAVGWPDDLDWMRCVLEKVYALKHDMIGPGRSKTGIFLKRKLEWRHDGIYWMPNTVHADALIERWARPTECRLPVGPEAHLPPTGAVLEGDLAKAFRGGQREFSTYATTGPISR